jgi:anti-sigma factor RsiW
MSISGNEMKQCEDIQTHIADYSVGNLNAEQMDDVTAHLAACPDCANELKVLQAAMSLVEELPQAEPPAGMWSAVYEQIAPETAPSLLERIQMLFAPPTRALAGGFAVLMLLVVMIFGRPGVNAPTAVADAATQEYVQEHVMYTAQDAFADRVALTSVSAAAMTEEATEVN